MRSSSHDRTPVLIFDYTGSSFPDFFYDIDQSEYDNLRKLVKKLLRRVTTHARLYA